MGPGIGRFWTPGSRICRLDFGRDGSHVPSGEVIASSLSEGPPGQVKRLGHVVGDDRGHDHHPDIIAAAAELPVDPRARTTSLPCSAGRCSKVPLTAPQARQPPRRGTVRRTK